MTAADETRGALFSWDETSWSALAFPTVPWALEAHRALDGAPPCVPAGNPPGESPNCW